MVVCLSPSYELFILFGDLFYGLIVNSTEDLGSAEVGSTTAGTGEILIYKALSLLF